MSNTTTISHPLGRYLITGATGDVGARVVDRLIPSGQRPRVFVRDEQKARFRFQDRVEVWVGDLADQDSLKAALQGMDGLFLVNIGPQIPLRDELAARVAKAARVFILPNEIVSTSHQLVSFFTISLREFVKYRI